MSQLMSSSHRQNHFCAQELIEIVIDFSCFYLKIRSWSSSISVWVGYPFHSWGTLVWFMAKARDFSHHYSIQINSWGPAKHL